MVSTISAFRLIRVRQWVKNLAIFLPLFFAHQISDSGHLMITVAAFFAFSFLASAVYVLNDIVDAEEDRQHPVKQFRPIASGQISPANGVVISLIMLSLAGITAFFLPFEGWLILILYFILNLSYSFGLKRVPILDLFIISTGFILRIFMGAVAGDVPVTMWIILMTFLLAMFLGIGKRMDDVINLSNGKLTRKSVVGYNEAYVSSGLALLAPVTVMAYISYTISQEVRQRFDSEYLYLTSVFVILGFLRYFQILLVEKSGSNPTDIIFKDRILQVIILIWLITFGLIIYKPFGTELI